MFTLYANQPHRHHRSYFKAPTFQERKLWCWQEGSMPGRKKEEGEGGSVREGEDAEWKCTSASSQPLCFKSSQSPTIFKKEVESHKWRPCPAHHLDMIKFGSDGETGSNAAGWPQLCRFISVSFNTICRNGWGEPLRNILPLSFGSCRPAEPLRRSNFTGEVEGRAWEGVRT